MDQKESNTVYLWFGIIWFYLWAPGTGRVHFVWVVSSSFELTFLTFYENFTLSIVMKLFIGVVFALSLCLIITLIYFSMFVVLTSFGFSSWRSSLWHIHSMLYGYVCIDCQHPSSHISNPLSPFFVIDTLIPSSQMRMRQHKKEKTFSVLYLQNELTHIIRWTMWYYR